MIPTMAIIIPSNGNLKQLTRGFDEQKNVKHDQRGDSMNNTGDDIHKKRLGNY